MNLGIRGHWRDFGYGSIFPLSYDENNADKAVIMYTPLLQPLEELAFFDTGELAERSSQGAAHISDVGWQGGDQRYFDEGWPAGWPWEHVYWIGTTGQARWIEAFWFDLY
ncbi:hypothetical protein [Embleya sp. NPDC005575]|uniref:hypothetical protein n=1 Tax=Embleya sp. NPDC005575 TaxID=3156892 RepID=UPI0033A0973E